MYLKDHDKYSAQMPHASTVQLTRIALWHINLCHFLVKIIQLTLIILASFKKKPI